MARSCASHRSRPRVPARVRHTYYRARGSSAGAAQDETVAGRQQRGACRRGSDENDAIGCGQRRHADRLRAGIDILNPASNLLDVAPLGRDEDGLPFTMSWVRLHDEYEA